ncbi:MAG: hypothetical protein HWN69_09585 [Desulfobacterales bacterium]|nr:hypothetical protein [Desulfobacterales bacterium]
MRNNILLITSAVIILFSAILISCTSGESCMSWKDMEAGELYKEILQMVPEALGTELKIGITNHEWLRTECGISRPSSDAGADDVNEYLNELLAAGCDMNEYIIHFASGSFLCGIGMVSSISESPIRYENVGFGPQNVDIDVGITLGASQIEIILGQFDLGAIDEAMNRMDESVKPVRTKYKGVDILDWGGSGVDLNRKLAPPVYDQLGRGGVIAIQGDCIMRALEMETIKQMIDARKGDIPSLADNNDFVMITDALAEMGARNLYLSGDVPSYEIYRGLKESVKTSWGAIWEVELLDTYNVSGSGTGKDELGNYSSVVLVFDDAESAETNVEKLTNRINAGMELRNTVWPENPDEYEIRAEGRTLRVIMRGIVGVLGPTVGNSNFFMGP